MSEATKLLRKISDSRILFRHDLELDAEVANFLSAQDGECICHGNWRDIIRETGCYTPNPTR